MSFFDLSSITSFSIVLAVIFGLVRFKRIDKTYQPFILICIAAFCNELYGFIIISVYSKSNAVNANIYVWIDAILFVWLFKNLGAFKKQSWHFPLTLGLLTAIWIYDNLIWHRITTINSLFRICYSFCLLFLAIDQVNRLIVSARGSLLKDARFLICSGVLIFYSYKATIEVFYLLKLSFSDSFYTHIYFIMDLVNLFVNLIFALAILWIPKKQKFILPY